MRFLIVDDSAIITTILKKNLKHLGCQEKDILAARNALGAFAILHEAVPSIDVILLEVKLREGIDGFEFLEKLRRTDKITKVIIVSAFVDAPTLKRAISLGASDFIKKPFTLAILQDKLQKVLKSTEL